MLRRLLMAVLLLLALTPMWAWHDLGHIVVSKIAYARLDKTTRTKVDKIIAALNAAEGKPNRQYDFASAACWPDDIRRFGKNHTYDKWHYIDLPFSPDGTPTPKLDSVNAVWAIQECAKALQNPALSDKEKGQKLAFLLHIVGDIHMPLHCVERYTKAQPKGDRGGNDFHVVHGGRNSNLHFFWDVGGGLLEPEIGRPMGKEDSKRVADLVDSITKAYPASKMAGVNLLDPMAWAREGNALARSFVYDLPEDKEPPANYVDKTRVTTRKQLALAGYRLGALLNSIFKSR